MLNTARLEPCPIARSAAIVGGKWTLLIIRDLAEGTRRFSELERSLTGISPKTLSDRLRRLEHEDVIRRRTYAEVPARVEYSLTEKGEALIPILTQIRDFGERWT